MAGVMMLEHLGEPDSARRIENAMCAVIAEGKGVTPDLHLGSTAGITKAIIKRLA